MVLAQKWPFFHLFILGNIGQEVEFCDIIEIKKVCLSYKNKTLKRSKNKDFLKGMFLNLVKNWPFFHVFILGNIGQENVFTDILEEKNVSLS